MQRLSMSHVNRKAGELRLWGIPCASLLFNSQLIACPGIRRASAFFMFRDISREASARHRGNYQVHARLSKEAASAALFFSFFSAGSLWHAQFFWCQFSMEPISCSASGPPNFGSGLDSKLFQAPHLLQQPSTYLPGECKGSIVQSSRCPLLRHPFSSSLWEAVLAKYRKL